MSQQEENIRIPRIIFYEYSEINEYFNKDNLDVMVDILDGIQQGYDLKLNEADIFEVEISNTKDVMLFSLTENDWVRELNIILNKFIYLEQYELADRASKLISKIKQDLNSKKSV